MSSDPYPSCSACGDAAYGLCEACAHEQQAADEADWYRHTFGLGDVTDEEVSEVAARQAERWREALDLLAQERGGR